MANAFAIVPQVLAQTLAVSQASQSSTTSPTPEPNPAFIRLPNPRTDVPSLYLPQSSTSDSSSQILEVQTVAPDAQRSWFFGQNVISDGRLITLAPVDPIFLLVPILRAVFTVDTTDPTPDRYRTADDIFEEASLRLTNVEENLPPSQTHMDSPIRKSSHHEKGKGREDRPIIAADVVAFGALTCVQRALLRVCETQEVTEGLHVYRYSPSKFLDAVREKVVRLSDPAVFNTFNTLQRIVARAGLSDDSSNIEEVKREELASLARIKASCDVVGQYLPSDLFALLHKFYDFTPLEEHLAAIEPPDAPPEGFTTNSKKSNADKAQSKKEAASGKKKNGTGPSRAAELLKKADTKGMSKLSTFFKKK